MEQKTTCCQNPADKKNRGLIPGIIYGLLPHSFCIAFVVFSIFGAVTATAFLKHFLIIPYLFHILVVVSLVLATLSSAIYLKRNKCLCLPGIKNRWKYIATLYSATILVNVLMFFAIIPALANINSGPALAKENIPVKLLSINVQIPCSGHAPLIIDEIKKDRNVQTVRYRVPNTFEIQYNPEKTSPKKITSLNIFKIYEATINQQ